MTARLPRVIGGALERRTMLGWILYAVLTWLASGVLSGLGSTVRIRSTPALRIPR